MNNQDYEQKKRECWKEFQNTIFNNPIPISPYTAFSNAFDRAYALGKKKETITQEDIEKAAREYVLTRQQARHNAKKEEDATMRDFDKTIKAWDAYDMEQAFESGANIFIGRQEKDTDTVIQGWVGRDKDGAVYVHKTKPYRGAGNHGKPEFWVAEAIVELPQNSFPDLTWSDEPQEVEIIIKRKKK